tara:strand:+ start:797 stop:1078 length:282 start_codon:yes stop_codon:yes gene_type:complete
LSKQNKKLPDYRYAEPTVNKQMGSIRIMNGKFKNLTYQYGLLSFSEGEEKCSVNFTYQILDNPEHHPKNEELKDIMGGILVELLNNEYGGDND